MNLSFLLYLACPIGMGVMMWMMMRDNKGQPAQSGPATPPADLPALRQQLDSLEIQQKAIRAQMQRISDEDSPRQQADPADRLVARRDEIGQQAGRLSAQPLSTSLKGDLRPAGGES